MERSARARVYSNPKARSWTGVTVFCAYLILLMLEVYIEFFENQSHLRVYHFIRGLKMVRTYIPKTDRNKISENAIQTAISEVVSETLSLRAAASKYNIAVSTLHHRITKFKNNVVLSPGQFSSKYTVAQVFTTEQEKQLTEYLVKCSKMHYGLTMKQTMTLAYEYAEKLQCKYPESWKINGCAGKDWVRGFRMRNDCISLRKPENTSAARNFAFNKTAVTEFFDNYESVLTRHKFTPDRILNLDETGISTVLPTPKVMAEKSQRQVGQVVSGERGELVTFCGIVTAIGTALPPVFVFPRVHYKEHFLNGAPEGSLGLANRTGWMTADLHIEVLKHIQRHTSSTVENPVLIICDNHESHISLEAINYCRSNGIVYLSLPPHTSHKLQPLDVCIFGSFKGKLKVSFNDWHIRNVGKTLTIYNVAELTKSAFLESFNPRNIASGFSKPGIRPFNRLAFTDDDYAPIEIYNSTTADLAAASNQVIEETNFISLDINIEIEQNELPHSFSNIDPLNASNPDSEVVPSTSATALSPTVSSNNTLPASTCQNTDSVLHAQMIPSAVCTEERPPTLLTVMSPEVVRPYPTHKQLQKDGLSTKRGREKGKSRVFTDTPEKDRLQALQEEKEKKQVLKATRQKAKELKTARKLLGLCENKKNKKRRRCSLPDPDSDSSHRSITLSDDETMDAASDQDSSHDGENINDPDNIKVSDFLLVKFAKKKTVVYYVATVIKKYNLTEYQVLYLRKKPGSWVFVFPVVQDQATVDVNDVVLHLPKPMFTKGTSRTSELYKFPVDFSQYNVQ